MKVLTAQEFINVLQNVREIFLVKVHVLRALVVRFFFTAKHAKKQYRRDRKEIITGFTIYKVRFMIMAEVVFRFGFGANL